MFRSSRDSSHNVAPGLCRAAAVRIRRKGRVFRLPSRDILRRLHAGTRFEERDGNPQKHPASPPRANSAPRQIGSLGRPPPGKTHTDRYGPRQAPPGQTAHRQIRSTASSSRTKRSPTDTVHGKLLPDKTLPANTIPRQAAPATETGIRIKKRAGIEFRLSDRTLRLRSA